MLSIREKAEFGVQTVVGNFKWNASDLTASFVQESHLPPIELPFSEVTKPTIAPISTRSGQRSFSEKLQNHYRQYTETTLEAITDDPDDLQNVLREVRRIDNLSSVENLSIRPPKPQTTALGCLTAFGLTEDFTFNRIALTDDRSRFQKLTARTIRLKTTASVLYLPDISTASVAQAIKFPLESTSPHYCEFLTGLGWTVDLQSHRGFSGGLSCGTSVYYSDCFHELMWHVGGLMKEQSDIIAGNHTHVIWCDGNFDFSSFATPMREGKAFVVIHPLPVGLFFVKIILTNGIQANPGFVKNLVVSKRVLPVFVRQTVLGIRIAVVDATTPFQIPPREISTELHSIIRESGRERNMITSELLLELLPHP